MEASEEQVVLVLDVMGFPAALVEVVEVEAMVLDWVVQVAAPLEPVWAEGLVEAQEEVVAPAAVMAPPVALEVASEEVSEGATAAGSAAGSAVASNCNKVSSP